MQPQELEMVANVIGEINFVRQLVVFSDRFGIQEFEKMQEDYSKDLKLNKPTKATVSKYLKNTTKVVEQPKDDGIDKGKDEKTEEIQDSILSRNTKINFHLANGLAA